MSKVVHDDDLTPIQALVVMRELLDSYKEGDFFALIKAGDGQPTHMVISYSCEFAANLAKTVDLCLEE